MTFKTKFKIGDIVTIGGTPRMIEEVNIDVGRTFKNVLYRYFCDDRCILHNVTETELLNEKQIEG